MKITFKDTYTIIKEISEVFDTLTDVKQAEVLEMLAGKRQGQVVASMITNFESAKEAIIEMSESAGSAMEEQEKTYGFS